MEQTATSSRAEHLAWCKARASEYLDGNDVSGAAASFVSDMNKHRETAKHPALMLMAMQLMGGHLAQPAAMRKFIADFN